MQPWKLGQNSRMIVVYPVRTIRQNTQASALVESLCAVLGVYGHVERLGRDDLSAGFASSADLVIAVGGDGTTLAVARYLEQTPLLSLKLKDNSVGYLCSSDMASVSGKVFRLFEGGASVAVRQRMALEMDGQIVGEPAYNDILIANACPARATRYVLMGDGMREKHCSSGIWLATASGSHAAARSAGATPLADDDMRFLFRVRELGYADVPDPTIGWTFDAQHAPTILAVDHHLVAYGDGDLWHVPIPCGASVRVRAAAPLYTVRL